MLQRASFLLSLSLVVACGGGGPTRSDAAIDASPFVDGGFVCRTIDSTGCVGSVWHTCIEDGEFLSTVTRDCAETRDPMDNPYLCLNGIGCALCSPNRQFCVGNDAVLCDETGNGYDLLEECDLDSGEVCRDGECRNLCDVAIEDKSYQGCEFYAADLDNASLGRGRDASAQQYSIVVSNPSPLATEVVIEVNDAAYGDEPVLREVERILVLPGDLETFDLPRREVDGSSSNRTCANPSDTNCPVGESCVCGSAGAPPCFCRVSMTATGMNDGTHTALTSQAYRVRSQFPIIAYQFNPLTNAGVFSNDASLLIPTSATGTSYTVVGWPQTIADGDCDPVTDPRCADVDFDTSRDDEDLRGFLTILGGPRSTVVDVTFGAEVVKVVGNSAAGIPESGPGDMISITLGPFDVLNLETDGLNGDFTGTIVSASEPISVFVGSEASDAPRFDTYATRQCCADHLEEQLFGDEVLGSSFLIARMPRRSSALNAAFTNPDIDSVAEVNEPEYVRVVAVAPGTTTITTDLPAPFDRFDLLEHESVILTADQDFRMRSTNGAPLAVLQTLPSQQVIGIPSYYPGGDPAIISVPPIEQYRRDYVFLTPDLYAFDFVVITADATTNVLLDGMPLFDPAQPALCSTSPADGIVRMPGDPPPTQVIHRCQLSFPDVGRLCDIEVDPECDAMDGGGGRSRDNVRDGEQNDGTHTVLADQPVGLLVYGFDAFVSYAYAGGLNLKPLPR
ncbi:MAG: IgGFc-binding protein [Sandaracinus sp.]|nr:IgGFc-binding protein [Sandaracinus sp.]